MLRILLLIWITLGVAACTPPQQSQSETAIGTAPESAFSSPFFEVIVTGQGPDLILVPGLASNADVWADTVVAFKDSYTVHVIQVSGFGGAPANGNAGNENVLDDLSTDLVRYMQSLKSDPVMVGHSLGGLVTLKTALLSDARLDAIVIVDVLPFFSVLMDEAATADSMAPVSAIMKATLLAQSDEVFKASQDAALASLVKSEAHRALALDWSVRSDRAVMAQAMSEVLVTDLRSQIGEIDVPTTVIFAHDESIPNMARNEAFYRDSYAPLADGTVVAIDDALHFIMLDQPDAFIEALRTAIE